MANLYLETKEKLEELDFTWDSIKYISVKDSDWKDDAKLYEIKIDDFIKFAKSYNYDEGFGGAEVNKTLRIVFYDDSFLERGEYDGSEWWEYKKLEKPIEMYKGDVKKILSTKLLYIDDDDELPDAEGIY